jgi:hypothetical protein
VVTDAEDNTAHGVFGVARPAASVRPSSAR